MSGSNSRRMVTGIPGHVLALLLGLCPSLAAAADPGKITTVPVGVVPYAMAALDLDGDGPRELVVGGIDQDAICALTLAGKTVWRYETAGMPLAVAVGDVDGDGGQEIVALIGTSASQVIVLDRQGKRVREFVPAVIAQHLQVADINGDKRDEIVVGGFMGKVLAYDGTGRKLLDQTVVEHNFYRKMWGLQTGDVNGDRRIDIAYHSAPRGPGAIDGSGKMLFSRLLPPLGGGLLRACADIDDDGQAELLFGCVKEIWAERNGKTVWSAKVGQSPTELRDEADGITKYPWEYGGMRQLAAGNFTKDLGLEVASFASDGKFDLLSYEGKSLLRAKTKHPLLSIAVTDLDGDGFDEALLSRLHYPNVYVVRFGTGTGEALRRTLGEDFVTETLDCLLSQIEKLPGERSAQRANLPQGTSAQRANLRGQEKLHVLWGSKGGLEGQLAETTFEVFHRKMQESNSDRVEFAFMFTLTERGAASEKEDGICAVPPFSPSRDAILAQCRQWEQKGMKFFPVVSHMGVPTVTMPTAKQILDVAPNACQGYLIWETMANYPGKVWYSFLGRMDELARLCVQRNKKILFAEEAPFWMALVCDPKARSLLLKPEYKGVLVPVLKTLTPYCDETDISAYLGSWLAGEIETWGITSEEDFWPEELGHYRGCPDDLVMRQEMMALALGARYILIESGHIYWDPLDEKGQLNLFKPVTCRLSREARREHLAVELWQKGVIAPVRAEDLLSISPVGVRISRSPRLDTAPKIWEGHGTQRFNGAGLVNWSLTNVMFNSGEHSLSRHLYGSKKMMNGLFPANRWGIVPVVGPGTAVSATDRLTAIFDTDGELVTRDGRKVTAEQAMPEIRRTVEQTSAALPFRADGVFISARRDGPDRYQVFLMDPELFAPADIETAVVTPLSKLTCADDLTGEPLPLQNGQVSVTVPAGGWRLLRFDAGR